MSAAPRRRVRIVARLALLPVAVTLALVLSAIAWLVAIEAPPPPWPEAADGIVVLTGGADRVATGLRLLREGRGPVLLVSGVGGSAALADLVHRAGAEEPAYAGLAGRVTLGRAAASTHGNAQETAAWARGRGMRSLIVVTANYHMPRALLELGRALPGVRLLPVAVRPAAPQWRLLAEEYAKWLATRVGLSGTLAGGDGRVAESERVWTTLWAGPCAGSRGNEAGGGNLFQPLMFFFGIRPLPTGVRAWG